MPEEYVTINKENIMDENNLNQAYNHLLMRMEQHFEAAERAARLRTELEFRVMTATRDGQIVGKNETERKVAAFTLFEAENRELAQAEQAEREAKFHLDYARTVVDLARALLRVAELNHGASND